MLRYFTKYVLLSREFAVSLFVLLLVSVGAFLFQCAGYYGRTADWLVAADQLFIGRYRSSDIELLFRHLLPLVAAIPFADVFYNERENSVLPMTLTRFKSRRCYYFSTGAAVFAATFVVVFIPLLINILLLFIAFPLETMRDFTGSAAGQSWRFDADNANANILLPSLYIKHPYIHNVFTASTLSLFAGAVGVFTYALSYLIRKKRSLLYMAFFIVYNIGEMISGTLVDKYNLINISLLAYLFPNNQVPYKSALGLCIPAGALFAAIVVMTVLGKKKLDDAI